MTLTRLNCLNCRCFFYITVHGHGERASKIAEIGAIETRALTSHSATFLLFEQREYVHVNNSSIQPPSACLVQQ